MVTLPSNRVDAAAGGSTGLRPDQSNQCIASDASVKMSKKYIFSSAEDDMLIEIVEKNRVLFDSSDPKHKDLNYKDSIWEDIGKKLNRNSEYEICFFNTP